MTTLPIELIHADAVYALAASGGALYAGRGSGLYRSADDGATWQNALESLGLVGPMTITAVAAHARTVFAGTKGAVLKSNDAGQTWDIVGLASPPPTVTALALSPAYDDDGTLFAATAQDGVFISTDGGAGWIPWNFGLIDLNVNALAVSPHFAADRTLFIGTESGVFRSTNGGRAWRETAFPMEAAPVVGLALDSDGHLYAGTEGHGLYASDDSGKTWTSIGDFASSSISAIETHEDEIRLLLDDRIAVSDDNGQSWQPDVHRLPPDRTPMTMLSTARAVTIGFADGDVLALRL